MQSLGSIENQGRHFEMFWSKNLNILLAPIHQPMNAKELEMLRFRHDGSQDQFCPLLLIWVRFPPTHTDALPSPLVYSQNKVTIGQKQPSIGTIHFKLVRCVSFAVVVRQECSTQNMHQMTLAKQIFQFLFLPKSKGKRTPSHPTVSIMRMRRVVT